ncbi:MAG: DUF2059 domain-containing protein [Alphaproteobacteria bacterium]
MLGRIAPALMLGVLLTAAPVWAQTAGGDGEKAALVRELMQMNNALGSAEIVAQAMRQNLTSALRQRDPNLPPAVAKIVEEETLGIVRSNQNALVTEVIKIYDSHFTAAELKDILAFYRTPAGQKFAKITPTLAQESVQAGQRWAQGIAPKLAERIKGRAQKEANYTIP